MKRNGKSASPLRKRRWVSLIDALLRLTKKTFPTVTVPGGERTFETYEYGANCGSGAFTLGGFQPTRITNKRGWITDNHYDAAYRLWRTIRRGSDLPVATGAEPRPGEPTVSSTYNRVHKKITETIANTDGTGPQTTTIVYDKLYRVTATTNALGFVTSQTYDKAGNVLTVTDAENHTTVNTFDGASRLIQTQLPAVDIVTNGVTVAGYVATTAITYDANGNKETITDPRGTVTRLYYDARDRVTNTVADANGLALSTVTHYDLTAHPIRVTDPRGNTTATAYDNAYRAVTNTAPEVIDAATGNPVRPVTITTYDKNGNVTQVTDPRGVIHATVYDAWNRAVAITDAVGTSAEVVTTTTYDANNNVLTLTLHNNVLTLTLHNNGTGGAQTTTYTFDDFDRKTSETLPDAGDSQARCREWAYFQNGTTKNTKDAKGQVSANAYDLDNRLTQVQFLTAANGSVTETRTFTYNHVDKLLVATDAAGSTTNTYDALYRLLTETRINGTNHAYIVQNFYDQAGNRTKVVYPGTGRVLLSQYDALNRLSQIADGTNTTSVTTYGYDANGNRVSLVLPNGQVTTNQFDALNRVTNMVNQVGNTQVYSVAYAYDPIGNRLSVIEDLATQGVRTNNYAYDDQYRLTSESSLSSVLGLQSSAYTFDKAGNRLTVTKITGSATNVIDYTYDKLNRLVTAITGTSTNSYAYDLNGSRISKTVAISNQQSAVSYIYDTQNRLVAALDQNSNTIFAAAYDYRTRRISVTEGLGSASPKLFRYDSGDSFQELSNATLSVEFIRGSGMGGGIGSILYSDRGATREHFAYNAVGHTVALTLQSGAVTNTQYYEAYGGIVSSTGQSDNNRLANTKERSFTLGLDNHGMRYFDPEVGRYITADPIGYGDGLNVYIYVHNNPINHVDPLGLAQVKFQRDEDQEKYEQDVRREQQRALEDQKKKEGWFLSQLHELVDPMSLVALTDRAKEIVDAPYKQNFQKEYDHARGELLDKYRNEHNGKSPGLLEQYRISEQAKKQAVDKLGYSVSTLDETLNQVVAIGMMSPGMTAGHGPVVVPKTTKPPSLTPAGAGRTGALREALRRNGVSTSKQPDRVLPNTDRNGKTQPGRIYEYDIPKPGGGTQTVRIRDDAGGSNFGPGDPQNRGPHFNDESGKHYDY